MTELKSRDFLIVILLIQFVVCVIVFFDAPVIRQVVGFVYLTTIPGFIIINILKLYELDISEIVLLSVGFSIAFLIICGLLVNELCLAFGFTQPLSLFSLMITLNSFILLGVVFLYIRKNDIIFPNVNILSFSFIMLPFLSLPVISIIGSIWVNAFKDNSILLFMIILLTLMFIATVALEKRLSRFYPICLVMIAISLLFHSAFISNYLFTFGSDIAKECFIFITTKNNLYWSSIPEYTDTIYGRYHSMLSITILPTIYSNMLNMNEWQVLRILYPIIFSLVPLTLYQLWQREFGKKEALLAVFLFIANNIFYDEMLGLARQMIGELFFVLLLLVILNKKIKYFDKQISFMIFSLALILSHYALAIIFLFFISTTYILSILMKRKSTNLTLTMILYFFIIMFSWYIYISKPTVFNSILTIGNYVFSQLDQFFNLASRDDTVLRGLGLEMPPSIWHIFGRGFAYITELFILLGFIGLITKRISIISRVREYFIFTIMAMALLFMVILVPGLAKTMNMTRFYHLLLFFLAPLFMLGAKFLVKLGREIGWHFGNKEKEGAIFILMLVVLIPYFLFQTEFVYEVVGAPENYSLSLSWHRMDAYRLYARRGYIDSQDAWGAEWIQKNVVIENTHIFAGLSSRPTLQIYGNIYRMDIFILSNVTDISLNGTIYLNTLNIIYDIFLTRNYIINLDQLPFLATGNKIYTNGGSEIYRKLLVG